MHKRWGEDDKVGSVWLGNLEQVEEAVGEVFETHFRQRKDLQVQSMVGRVVNGAAAIGNGM
jgi:hypothetical protein